MTDILKHIYNACNPIRPASAEYYVDCADVRGSTAMAGQFIRALTLADDYKCLLFSGHIGCGKSSELVHLSQELAESVHGRKRYFPILLKSGDYLDPYDVTPTDILLAIVTEIASALRGAGIELRESYLQKRLEEFKDVLLSEAEMTAELTLLGAKSQIQRLQKDPTARRIVRESLQPHMTTVLDEINSVFNEARLGLKKMKVAAGEQPYHDFVLIIDELDKIEGIAGHEVGSASHRELFINRAPTLRGLKGHIVYTVPLPLVRSDGPALATAYGRDPLVLPMIKVARRGTYDPYEGGREHLKEMVQKRAGKTSLQDLIEPEALEYLITFSGGHVRYLLSFLQQAVTYIDAAPVTRKAARSALRETINIMAGAVRAAWWPKLAALHVSANQSIDNNDPDMQKMLELNFVLEYLNGEDEGDEIVADAPWYAVHPILRELPQFTAAVAALSASKGE
jgi:hypothetical protein